MCGRFTLRTRAEVLADVFQLPGIPELPLRYNIAPTQLVTAVLQDPSNGDRRVASFHWGLIPSWAKDRRMGAKLINARSETVEVKPAFRAAFRRRRCVILADGYFEWSGKGKSKQPYYIRMFDDRPFAFAGLWERWQDPTADEALESCTIITTVANRQTQTIHDRMPVILEGESVTTWLAPEQQEPAKLKALLQPFPSDRMRMDPVSPLVNNPRNDGPDCIRLEGRLF